MPRLLLLRHAKSSSDDPGVADFDRPLAARGRRAAAMVGEHIAKHRLTPDRILCSAARRTRETLAQLLPNLVGETEIRLTRSLYDASRGYKDIIAAQGSASATLMVIGHNPAMQEAAAALIGSGNPALAAEVAGKFPTAGLAVIDFDFTGWRDLTARSGRIVAFYKPRDLELVGAADDPNDDD